MGDAKLSGMLDRNGNILEMMDIRGKMLPYLGFLEPLGVGKRLSWEKSTIFWNLNVWAIWNRRRFEKKCQLSWQIGPRIEMSECRLVLGSLPSQNKTELVSKHGMAEWRISRN